MIVCPNCNHQNPDAAVQCEACYTPLPAMMSCPNCGAAVQSDASFCGQCGFNLKSGVEIGSSAQAASPAIQTMAPDLEVPDLIEPEPLMEPESLIASGSSPSPHLEPEPVKPSAPSAKPVSSPTVPPTPHPTPAAGAAHTTLQTQSAQLIHIRSNTSIELPPHLAVIHIGKPNERIPPDVDVSGFPDSEIVSRSHADIRVEAGTYYIEDVGSSNGTYINNVALPPGNRHRLRPGDRIALGKGDKVAFLFQMTG